MHKKLFFLLGWAFLLLHTMGCQNEVKEKQILKINFFQGVPESFHPQLVTSSHSMTLSKALFEGLTRMNPEGKVELAIAKSIEVSPCGKKYVITLRKTKWSNGKELTAAHFVHAWKKAVSVDSKCVHARRFFLIKNAKKTYGKEIAIEEVGLYAPSKNQIVVELEHPAPYFPQILADPAFSPLYECNYLEPKVFNGPFLLKDYNIEKTVELISNATYWDAKTVRLKKIKVTFVRDANTAMSMYEQGELDWMGSPFSEIPEEVIQNSKSLYSEKAYLPFWLYCNTQNPKLKSAKIRKALSFAIDREQIAKYILAKQSPSYSVLPEEMSLLKQDNTRFKKNVEKAQQLLAEGLKEIGLKKEEFTLVLSHSEIPRHVKLAEFFKFSWEKVLDIPISLKKNDWSTFYTQIQTGDYEIGGYSTLGLYNDPTYFMDRFEMAEINFSKWENADFQKYMALAKKTVSDIKRREYLQISENILIEELPVIPIYNHNHLYLQKNTLKNLYPPKLAYADFKWAYFDE